MSLAHQPARAPQAAAPETETMPPAQLDAGMGNAAMIEQLRAEQQRQAFPFQAEMEAAFGMDLSHLDVGFGAGPAAVGAVATAERGAVRFSTSNPDKETVAHEVAHAVQFEQHGGAAAPGTSKPEDAAEHEAEKVAADAAAGKEVTVREAPSAETMRKVTYAKQDKYNDGSINNNDDDAGDQVERQRPGVTLGSGKKRDDTFRINEDGVPLYYGNGEVRSYLESNDEVCVNPAAPRNLGGENCVLCWTGTDGPGWVPAHEIYDGKTAVGSDLLNKLWGDTYEDWRPDTANFKYATSAFVFRHDGPTVHDSQKMPDGTGEFVFPNQDSGNHTKDHLRRKGTSESSSDDYYNVFMNLPQSDAAAVAHDVAQPGEYFYVVKVDGHFLKRYVDTFKEDSEKHGKDLTFVYGYVGDSNGPDESRGGWVVYQCLERA